MKRPAKRRLELVVLGHEETRATLPTKGTLIVGSSSERADFVVDGQGVEDAHCAIGRMKDGSWAVKDLGTRYGTLVNGSRIESARLEEGDLLVLGSRRLGVRDPDAEPEPTAKPAIGKPAEPGLSRVGGYRIEKLLGKGAMGKVYLAVQESLSRPVALKVLPETLAADADFVRRFQSEARAAAALNHPNVVVVHDVGEAGGKHFLSMEFMPGGSLEERVAEHGPMPWRRVLDVLYDAACGLKYAEERGIVHRDIKPANLMLTGTGTVKIADLGLATHIASPEARGDEEERRVFGTPHFISPEQARGQPVDHRSDLYSLGATAYRLLSGRTPFTGESTRDILRAHFSEEPASLAILVPGLPQELSNLCLRLMAKDPARRLPSAEALRREVERLRLESDHGEALPALDEERPRRRVALVLGLLAIGAAITFGLMRDPDEPGGSTVPGAGQGVLAGSGDTDLGAGPTNEDEDFFGTDAVTPEVLSDEEQALRVLELEAEIAYRDLEADLSLEDRIVALGELAARFPGTRLSASIDEEVRGLRDSMRRARVDQARLEASVDATLIRLRQASGWPPAEGALPRPGDFLRMHESFRPAPEVAGEPLFLERMESLYAEVTAGSLAAMRAELSRLDETVAQGHFEEASARLVAMSEALELPEPALDESEVLRELRDLAAEVGQRQAGLAFEEERWRFALAQRDRRVLGAALGTGSGFQEELTAIDHAALELRLDELRAALSAEADPTSVVTLAEDVERARAALSMLTGEFQSGWRRRSLTDPRDRRPVAREAVGATSEGVVIAEDGQGELVPWSVFGQSVDALDQLFKGRLTRAYTAEEVRGIVTLLRIASVCEVARAAQTALTPGGLVPPPEDLQHLPRTFATANEWLADSGSPELAHEAERLAREEEATVLLTEALRAARAEAWSLSVSLTERLFADYGDTLLLVLLSDGSEWRTAAALSITAPAEAGAEEGTEEAPPGGAPGDAPPADTIGPDEIGIGGGRAGA